MEKKFKKRSIGYAFSIAVILLCSNFTYRSDKATNEKVVRNVYAAYEKKDWNLLKSLFAEGFTFTSPVDDHIDIKEYKVRCWPNSANIKKFELEKV
ncbi:MAG TPA: nuclear transport factor 2 family protein, partial [Mucilaginibacter sp.]|nr:nuclear transport factor 2 family protein [Mucilaginibacter sp.]